MALSYITVPIFRSTISDPALLVHLWSRMYHYGHLSAPPMALMTLAMYLYTARTYSARGTGWALPVVAGITTISIVPFTFICMVPTNDELFRLTAESDAGSVISLDEVRGLLVKWGWLHFEHRRENVN
ncbi:uncharacterized protein DNG_08926 [Cephalotrichum gorgonifer]|uniref:Uncharacterized protein n=1 Tax=Cephalotrichum gorgonifer TaxID=2041049 RepID=A0AAE8N7D7_9PEZI|nr:uncharacterized protein DNG_08926 [Cephalotrichum gorgonifer]